MEYVMYNTKMVEGGKIILFRILPNEDIMKHPFCNKVFIQTEKPLPFDFEQIAAFFRDNVIPYLHDSDFEICRLITVSNLKDDSYNYLEFFNDVAVCTMEQANADFDFDGAVRLANKANLWEKCEIKYPENQDINCYFLPRLVDIYNVPVHTGQVLVDGLGRFYITTHDLLDDFLSLTEKPLATTVLVKDLSSARNCI